MKACAIAEPWAKRLLPDTEVTRVGVFAVFSTDIITGVIWEVWDLSVPEGARLTVFRSDAREDAMQWAEDRS